MLFSNILPKRQKFEKRKDKKVCRRGYFSKILKHLKLVQVETFVFSNSPKKHAFLKIFPKNQAKYFKKPIFQSLLLFFLIIFKFLNQKSIFFF